MSIDTDGVVEDQTAQVIKVIPTPREPIRVAEAFIDDHWESTTTEDGEPRNFLRLRVQNQVLYAWNGTCWTPRSRHEMTVAIFDYTRNAVYLDALMGNPIPWNPTPRSVSEVVDTLIAYPTLQLAGDVLAPAWLIGEDDEDLLPLARPEGLVSVRNGLIDVFRREGGVRALYDHTPQLWNLSTLPFDFNRHTSPPARWLQFLDEVWPNDPESVTLLQQMFGYIISGHTDLQKAFCLVGPKRSGKGTIAGVLSTLVGRGAYASTNFSTLARNFGLQDLMGKTLAVISDARVDSRGSMSDAVERLLSITGGDFVPIDRKYKAPITVQLTVRFLVLTNEMPKLHDTSGALASRFVFIPMTKSFFGQEDTDLLRKLNAEASGILNWALDGLEELEYNGSFLQTASGQALADEMEQLGSPVKAFLEEQCIVDPNASVICSVLWTKWYTWATANGNAIGSSAWFGRELRTIVPSMEHKKARDGTNLVWKYIGVGLQ